VSGYFDAATAMPLHPVAREAMFAALTDGWADPGRLYPEARRARQLVDAALAAIAEVLGLPPVGLMVTSGGGEAAALAVAGIRAGWHRRGSTVVRTAVEHSALIKAAGDDAVEIPVDRSGRADAAAFVAALREPGVVLAAMMSANHEVGTRQPVSAVAGECMTLGLPLYVDAAQTVPWEPVPSGWTLMSMSARKWGGPAGIGFLYLRSGIRWRDPRPSVPSVNIPLLVGAAAALRAARADADRQARRLSALVDRIRAAVPATVPDVEVVGDPVDRLPHVVTFSCLYVDGEALLHALAREGFAVSSGSACTADTLRPSHVLAAMGVLTHGNIRISLHRDTMESDVERFLAVLPGVVEALRAEAGVTDL
jgi:cysteine desulfurase